MASQRRADHRPDPWAIGDVVVFVDLEAVTTLTTLGIDLDRQDGS